MTTTTTTLADSLRHAADVCDAIGWDGSITWAGRNGLHLHLTGDEDFDVIGVLIDDGAIVVNVREQTGDDYVLIATELVMPSGLSVTVFGPRRPLAGAA